MTKRSTTEPITKKQALIVDDEPAAALILSTMLENNGFKVRTASNDDEMLAMIKHQSIDIIFLDYRLDRLSGLELLQRILTDFPRIKVIMITAHGSIDLAVQAMRMGASGFITKPFAEAAIERELKRACKQNAVAIKPVSPVGGIIGSSPAIYRIHEQIMRMKDVETTVLIVGESGTGKELVARALHEQSVRSGQRFEAVNCAAIPETLLESELFGHKRGAFTDAKADRKGLFEACSQGTLFLDEIGEMPIALQSKLLRVLQEKVIVPLGSSASVKISTRIVAATNCNLLSLVKEGKFRRDLYYRLSILQIETPPLRERPEDIGGLAQHFIAGIGEKLGRTISPISNELMARLVNYPWPGNVRELQNSLERAAILSEEGELQIEDVFSQPEIVADSFDNDMSAFKELSLAKDEFEKKYLERLLTKTAGNVAEASRIAGRIRTDMYRLFAKYEIDPANFKV